ncbi:MAG: tocopherol cyclase family protein [Oscillospiraceae bacterium]
MTKYYHGTEKRGPYFEGWYLKHQTQEGRALAFIPALHIDREGRRSASLQVVADDQAWWLEYPDTEFSASERAFQIRLGQSLFTREGVQLNIEQDGLSLHSALRYGPFTPLRSDIMGPFRFLSQMECSHGVISMGQSLEGTLVLNGKRMNFSGGTGYIETDRGRSFPSAYLWTQCAWKKPQSGSLMLSIAAIPLAIGCFTGCICAVLLSGREYRLATYRGARVEQWSAAGAVIRQGKYRLAVELLEGQGCSLRAPAEGSMGRIIHESLCAHMRYRFWSGDELLFEHTDRCAGFEYADERNHHA